MPNFFTLRATALSALAALTLTLLAPPSWADLVFPNPSSARADIDAALAQAASSHKRVLVQFGANWCGDCKALDENFRKPENAALLSSHFVLVHVNVGDHGIDHNLDLAEGYGIPLNKGVPALAVLDADGHVVFSQKNGEFEDARSLTPEVLLEFLTKWKP